METQRHEVGMIGLGVMGRNMLLNMADHGFPVAGYDNDATKVIALQNEAAGPSEGGAGEIQGGEIHRGEISGASNIDDFIGLLRPPRAVIMLVPAGPPVDSV